jgi:hypothetical protein
VKPGYREPLNVFTVTALASGNRKSAVFSEIAVPIQEHEERESERCAPEIAAASSSRNILEQRLRKVEGEGAKAKPEDRGAVTAEARELAQELARSVVPAAPRFLADDTSPERLATLLRDQGGRMAILSPEGDIFDLMAGKYSSNNAPNLGVFLKGHAGDTLRVDRVGRPTEYVKNPALTLGLAVQPEVLRGLVDKPGFRGRGLLGRFLYSLPPSLLGRRAIAPPDVPTSIRYDYCWRIQALLGLSFDVDEDGQPASHVLHLSDEARRTWVEFAAWLEPRLGTDGDLGVLTDWAGKLPGAVARLAGILHLAAHATDRTPWALPIGPDTMVDAVAIGRYLIPHARAAFAEMGAHPEIENAKHVAAWLTRQTATTLSERDIFQGTRGRFRQMGALRPALSILVEHGYLRRVDLLSRSFRGRPSGPTFEVNPHVWKTSEDIEHFEHIEEKPGSTDLHALDLPEKQSYSPNDLQSLDPGAIPQNPQYPQKADAPGSVAVQFTAPPGEELSLPDELSSGVGSERLS